MTSAFDGEGSVYGNRHFIQKKKIVWKFDNEGGGVFKNTEKMQTSFMNAP